jgi:hypothetical protein
MNLEIVPALNLFQIFFSFIEQIMPNEYSPFKIVYIYTHKMENSTELHLLPSNGAKVLEKSLIIIHKFFLHTSWQAATTSSLSIRGSALLCILWGLRKKYPVFYIKLTCLEISRVLDI